ncbi:hypothetical protein QUV83_08280 [Cellulomonas cellasea]|uniref:hypothetical protein n=1 Tax=Cellulomonas cellasea TaxID=43670 RepID=UPI0025A42A8A|nr:hypothetical protein [Cellulomonas cellasea]MDM8084757.1 hypothetical protein [Cellulomonas cellasea]
MPDEAATLAVVVARLDDLRGDVSRLSDTLTAQRGELVGRGEWMMRNQHVDSVTAGLGREIGDLRGDVRSRRLPWPSVAAAIVSIAALGLTVTQAMGGA